MKRPLVVVEGWTCQLPAGEILEGGLVAARVIGANQSLSSGVWTRLNFSSVATDTHNHFSSGTPNRLTAQVAGFYLIGHQIQLPNNDSSNSVAKISYGGVDYAMDQTVNARRLAFNACEGVYISQGQFIELWIYHNASSTVVSTKGVLYLARLG